MHNEKTQTDTNLSGSIQLSAGSRTWRSAEAAGAEEDLRAPRRDLERGRQREKYCILSKLAYNYIRG